MTNVIVPKSKLVYEHNFLSSNTSMAQKELKNLHSNLLNLVTDHDRLFQVTLESQEDAFANVRLTFTGDHCNLIK